MTFRSLGRGLSRRGGAGLPPGLVGALGGAIGAIPFVPIVAGLATRLALAPTVAGAARKVGDVKLATYAEDAVILVILPLFGFLFGRAIPRFLEARSAAGRLSFEWTGAGFAAAYFLAARGLRPKYSLIVGSALAAVIALGIRAFRASFRVRRCFSKRGTTAWTWILAAGASLDLARRASGGARVHLVDDLISEMALSGLGLAAVCACVAWLASPRPEQTLSRLARAARVATLAAVVVTAFPRVGGVALSCATALAAVVWSTARSPEPRPAADRLLVIVGLLIVGWRLVTPRVPWIDPFEDGHSLGPAESYLHGARPFTDVVPVHGWGSDGGVDGLTMRLFGPTLHVYQLRRSSWAAASLALLWGAALAALGGELWAWLGFFLALDVLKIPIERQMLALAALLLLLRGIGRARPGLVLAAGIVAGWELLHSLEYGLVLTVGGLAGLATLPLLEKGFRIRFQSDFRLLARFAAGVVAGLVPFLSLLAIRGGLGEFFEVSFHDNLGWFSDAWDLPVPKLWNGLIAGKGVAETIYTIVGPWTPPLFLLLLMASVAIALALRTGERFGTAERVAWVSLVVAMVATRPMLGRADAIHLERYGFFVALPATWWLMASWRSGRKGWAALLAFLIVLRLRPLRALEDVAARLETSENWNRAAAGLLVPRSGGLPIEQNEARTILAFRDHLDRNLVPGETFFDFANQPALYFFADRVCPIRYLTVAQYESVPRQQEVVAALEKRRPPVAVLGTGLSSRYDEISNAERAPLVAKYLDEHYERDLQIGEWLLLRRVEAKAAP